MKTVFTKSRIPIIVSCMMLVLAQTTEVKASTINPIDESDENIFIILEESSKAMFRAFEVNDETNEVDIVTTKQIYSIQVTDAEGQVIFFLPVVESDELNIGTSMFESGTYFINLGFEDEPVPLTARLEKR